MNKTFTDALQASAYCKGRDGDYQQLLRDMKARKDLVPSLATVLNGIKHETIDMGYCRIHTLVRKFHDGHRTNECWIANKRGETMAAGRNVTFGQVSEFILRKFW